MRRLRVIGQLVLSGIFLGMLLVAADAEAAITYGGVLDKNSGFGFGNKTELLSFEANNKNEQWGAIRYDGAVDVFTNEGDVVENKSQTVTLGYLRNTLGYTSDNFKLFFDVNQSGKQDTIEVNDFSLDFYNAFGGLEFSLEFTGSVDLGDNTGGSSDWDHYFHVGFDSQSQVDWFNTQDDWRIGMNISAANAMLVPTGGSEVFGLSAVPEPSTIVIWSIIAGAGVMGVWRKRRRQAA